MTIYDFFSDSFFVIMAFVIGYALVMDIIENKWPRP